MHLSLFINVRWTKPHWRKVDWFVQLELSTVVELFSVYCPLTCASGLQQQYKECQELLGLYQQYLSQQQEKLNQSISQLNHSRSRCRVISVCKCDMKCLGGLFFIYLFHTIFSESSQFPPIIT